MTDSAPSKPEWKSDANRLFRVLSHHHRRSILRILRQSQRMTIPDIAEQIARGTHKGPIDVLPSQEVVAIHTELYHHHIPMLVEAELIAYAEGRYSVTISDRGDFEACWSILSELE